MGTDTIEVDKTKHTPRDAPSTHMPNYEISLISDPPKEDTGARRVKEGNNAAPELDDPAPEETDDIEQARERKPLPPRRPEQVARWLIYIKGSPGMDGHHTTVVEQIEPGAANSRIAQAGKKPGKCKLGCHQALHSHQPATIHQLGFMQSGKIIILYMNQ